MSTEQFANNAQTSLNGAITAGQTSLIVASASGFPSSAQFRILIDSELMLVTAGAGSSNWTVTRGIEGTTAATHGNGATVTEVLTAGALEQLKIDVVTPPLTLTPATDATKALILQQHSATQSANLLECEESSGTSFGAAINGQGEFTNPNPPAASGAGNERFGKGTLASLTTGYGNTGIGYQSLTATTGGYHNTAAGHKALAANIDGYFNVGVGSYALTNNNYGSLNAAFGYDALADNTSGGANVGIGDQALVSNQTGFGNVSVGITALFDNVSGNYNTGIGFESLPSTTGSNNVGAGFLAGYHNTTGNYNSFIGCKTDAAAGNLSYSTAVGALAAFSASHEVILGTDAETVVIPGDFATLSNTPAAISANTNNYAPGNGAMQRWSASDAVNVTGMVAGAFDGQIRLIWNVGSNTITLTNQDAASSSANQWLTTTGANLALAANRAAIAQYDMTSGAWRVSLLP